jgi:short-subunit dehydrogenase
MGYDLNQRVVFITGASGGIGRACAAAFHQAGARVVATARSFDKLEDLARELGGERILPLKLDVTEADERTVALDEARKHFGPIDVLVNNAGWGSFASVLNMPREHYERMLSLNLMAPIALTQAVLPEMMRRGSGQIINIASVVGYQTIPRMTTYSATKAALISLSTGLRMELAGTGIDVIVVAPGSTRTNFFEAAGKVNTKAARFSGTQYSAERVARAVVRASRRRRREVVLTGAGVAAVLIRRFSHRLADLLVYLVAKKAMPEIHPAASLEHPEQ